MARKTRRGQKQCPKCSAWVKGTRTKSCAKCGHQFSAKRATPAPEMVVATIAKPTKAESTITLEHLRAVAEKVKAVGGFDRFNDLLGVIREVGGVRRVKEVLEAMSITAAGETKA